MAPVDAGFSPHHCAPPTYWSHRALIEDKKKCLTDLPHTDHQVSNTLEFLHEDKKHHSCRAVADKKRMHQPLSEKEWRRRPSTPTHPYATAGVTGEDKQKFWSHRDLMESKRTNRCIIRKPATPSYNGDDGPMTAREMRRSESMYEDERETPMSARSPGSIYSDSGRMMRSASVDAIAKRRDKELEPSGLRSPTMRELLQHDNKEEHPHNELGANWWKVCREDRNPDTPHRSHEKYSIKKQHHGIPIHEVPGSSTHRTHYQDAFATGVGISETPDKEKGDNRVLLYQRDPKATAVQGQYPHCVTNEAWAAPRGDETPPSRYHSCELMALDKRRHATPIDGGRRWQRMRVQCTGKDAPTFQSETHCQTTDKPKNYRSHFTLLQHKKKHLATLDAGRSPRPPPAAGNTPRVKDGDTSGFTASEGRASGWTSHRELQYAKRFNNVALSPRQQLHKSPMPDRPWPKPGDMLKEDASEISGTTPPYPSGPVREVPQSSTHRAHTHQAVSKYGSKAGAFKDDCPIYDDDTLLHCSQKELALRKSHNATTLRHTETSLPRSFSARSIADRNPLSHSVDDLPPGEEWRSQQHLSTQKMLHKFGHDDPRRVKKTGTSKASESGYAPPPRSGQWTPAHI